MGSSLDAGETDGTDRTADRDTQTELSALFEDIAGTTTIVEPQTRQLSSRYLGDGQPVSEYVSKTVADDGLADAVSSPDTDSHP